MKEFDLEVKEKKALARQAFHRKVGSRSKRVMLPSDRLTKKQWRERCGPVMTYRMNEPISWHEFKSYPPDIQKQYLEQIKERFHPTSTKLCEMFGIHTSTLNRFLSSAGIQWDTHRGARMTDTDLLAFKSFVGEECEPTQKTIQGEEADNKPASVETVSPNQEMRMTEMSLVFDGPFNISRVYNTLSQAIPSGTAARVHVKVEILE